MSVDLAILDGAMNRLQNSGPAGVPVAWPGIPFNPPDGETSRWLEASIFPSESANIAWQNSSPSQFRGFVQVLVGFRPNRFGIRGPWQTAEAIVALYPKGTALGPAKVSSRPSLGPLVADGGKSYIPVTIPYRGVA